MRFAAFWLRISCSFCDVNKTLIIRLKIDINLNGFIDISLLWCVLSFCGLGELLDCLHWYGIDHVDILIDRWHCCDDSFHRTYTICKCIQWIIWIYSNFNIAPINNNYCHLFFFSSFRSRITHSGWKFQFKMNRRNIESNSFRWNIMYIPLTSVINRPK